MLVPPSFGRRALSKSDHVLSLISHARNAKKERFWLFKSSRNKEEGRVTRNHSDNTSVVQARLAEHTGFSWPAEMVTGLTSLHISKTGGMSDAQITDLQRSALCCDNLLCAGSTTKPTGFTMVPPFL